MANAENWLILILVIFASLSFNNWLNVFSLALGTPTRDVFKYDYENMISTKKYYSLNGRLV